MLSLVKWQTNTKKKKKKIIAKCTIVKLHSKCLVIMARNISKAN